MQNKPSKAEIISVINNGVPVLAKIAGRGASKKGLDLRLCRRRLIGGTRLPRCGVAGNAPAPWKFGLRLAAIRVRQIISFWNIHKNEGVNHDLIAAGFKRSDSLENRGVRRRPAVNRAALTICTHQIGRLACLPAHRPVPALQKPRAAFNTGA